MFTNHKAKLSLLMLMLALVFFSTCKKVIYNNVNTISDSSIVITNATPGNLDKTLTESEKANTNSLKITGKIDARDFSVIHLDMHNLKMIDLSETNIVTYNGSVAVSHISETIDEIDTYHKNFKANTIPFQAFYGNVNVISILLPNSLKAIDSYAFESCRDLKEITIPSSDTSIGIGAFSDCSSLTIVTIPSSVKRIMGYASESSKSLSSITIPSSVSKIESYAFYNCTSLQSIHINKEIPIVIESNVFVNVLTSSCVLYVPKGTKSAYQVADGWKEFKNIEEE